jgi:hypothetical protein
MSIAINTLKDATRISVLDRDECNSIVRVIFDLHNYWIKRTMSDFSIPLSFWTLGYATYLDGPEGHKKSKQEMNAFLLKHFGTLYDKVIHHLQGSLNCPVKTCLDYNLPGFHIYQGNPALPLGLFCGGTIHYDTPHQRADFPFAVSDAEVFSFTLPVSLPRNGGGLNFWPKVPAYVEAGNWFHLTSKETQKWLIDNLHHLDYAVGSMVVHECNILHQMSNNVKTDETDWRITMQGHGVFREDHWMIYF